MPVMLKSLFAGAALLCTVSVFSQHAFSVGSRDRALTVRAWLTAAGEPRYTVSYRGRIVLKASKLGLKTNGGDFSAGLKARGVSPLTSVSEQYELFTGKKRRVAYTANRRVWHLQNRGAQKLDVIFQVSVDGVAFRYAFPEGLQTGTLVTEELTSFRLDTASRAFLQPMQVAGSGWEHSNPAYEEHYEREIPVATPSRLGSGWVYPALFKTATAWLLVTEAALDSTDCATRLLDASAEGEFRVGFPHPREVFTGGGLLPKIQRHGGALLPWRILAVGSLKTLVESTLGTDLAKPAIQLDADNVKPGKASWSWIMSKDDSIVFSEQIRYIDFAAQMRWQYCLVDAAWDQKIGYEKAAELSRYAASKGVGLLLWYNSSGDWNTVKYTPKSRLLTHESRVREFARLKAMGVKGVKIDFFGGDGQSMIRYYIDILNDAAAAGLLVNFHGATLPRGWARTYPHLLTAEAVRGFEMITFNQSDADAAAAHGAMLPFARNAFDPMDFTPVNLYTIPTAVKRKTTSAFELATSVLFLSGIQHFAESPEGMARVPEYVQQFLRELPTRWDDVRFVDGYPGKFAVVARKAGNRWYVAGINGESAERTVSLDLASFNVKTVSLITDGNEPLSFVKSTLNPSASTALAMKPAGGFVLVLE